MSAFVEDVSVFFQLGMPGVVAATINGVTVYGELVADMDETLDYGSVRSRAPALMCEFAALPAVAAGDYLTVGTSGYTVRELEHDAFDPVAILHLNNA